MERSLTLAPVVGIFVGGRGERMGGVAKGRLRRPDGLTLVEHLLGCARHVSTDVVLVGTHPAYAHLEVPHLPDTHSSIGPLGGLVSLLDYAGERPAVALACDMPFVTVDFLKSLVCAHPSAAALAPKADLWEPLAARYHAKAVLPVAHARIAERLYSLQGLLDALHAVPFVHGDAHEATRDWDTPEDVARSGGFGV